MCGCQESPFNIAVSLCGFIKEICIYFVPSMALSKFCVFLLNPPSDIYAHFPERKEAQLDNLPKDLQL